MINRNSFDSFPLAYFITFTCYGTWLHGGKDISIDKNHNIPGTEFLPKNNLRYLTAKKRMKEASYLLDAPRRKIVLDVIISVCNYKKWGLLAVHVRSNHVHIVIHAHVKPEFIMNTFKSYVSRQLNKLNFDNNRVNRWAHHGSTRYLWKEENIETAIKYVIHEQGEAMELFENTERYLSCES